MKKALTHATVFAFSLGLSGPLRAQETHQQHCIFLGNGYAFAVSVRDRGLSPKQAYNSMRAAMWQHIKPPVMKAIINMVYFNPNLAQATPEQAMTAEIQVCMGKKPYKPLK